MIYTRNYVSELSGIFHGWGTQNQAFDALDWESKLPTLQTMSFFQTVDPSYKRLLSANDATDESILVRYGKQSVISGLRNCMVRISTVWGYFQTANHLISTIFKDTIETAAKILGTVSDVLDNLSAAINSIGWVPIVGWIIKIIFEVAKTIVKIILAIGDASDRKDTAELNRVAKLYALPIAEWTPELDTLMGQDLQYRLGDGDFEWLISPRYPATSPADFSVFRQRYDGKKGDDQGAIDGYLIVADQFQSAEGLGFVPGTANIHSSIEVETKGGRFVKDLGNFFPTTQIMARSVWEQSVEGRSGATFAFDTDRVSDRWINYVQAAIEYAADAMGGWSMIRGRLKNSEGVLDGASMSYDDLTAGGLKFKCSSYDLGKQGCEEGNTKGKPKRSIRGDWVNVPGEGHKDAYIDHMYDLFGWDVSGGKILYDTIRPVKSLEAMKERQKAMLNSRKCMYLDDTGPRFKAITGNSALRSLWQNNVQALFESGDWKGVDYRDVIPGGDVDTAIRSRLSNMGTTPEKFFRLDSKTLGAGTASMGLAAHADPKTVLGDPEPPGMPQAVDVGKLSAVAMRPLGSTGGRSRKKSSAAPLLIGAAALGFLMMKGRK